MAEAGGSLSFAAFFRYSLGMKHLFSFLAALAAAVLLLAPLVIAPPAAFAGANPASTTRPPSVTKAEEYLRGLSTVKARFLQTAPDGTQMLGTFYLDRPGKLRFEYDDPIKDFVVADGLLIYFYDAQLGEQTNAPIGQTLADFLLRRDISFSGDVTVKKVSRGGGLLQIALVQTADPDAGSLTLGFEENPIRLKKWRVVDSAGAITEVELFRVETGPKLDGSLFVYIDPKRGAADNFNR